MGTDWMLKAFAPNGLQIVNTLECGIGTHQVKFFYRGDDGEFVHEFGDNYSDGEYPETVVVDGKTIYVDTDGTAWPEPALTYKTRDGVVVREGKDVDPFDEPSVEMAMTLGARAKRLAPGAEVRSESDWADVIARAGWAHDVQVIHLEGFIREMGLMAHLADYALRVADEEAAQTAGLVNEGAAVEAG